MENQISMYDLQWNKFINLVYAAINASAIKFSIETHSMLKFCSIWKYKKLCEI